MARHFTLISSFPFCFPFMKRSICGEIEMGSNRPPPEAVGKKEGVTIQMSPFSLRLTGFSFQSDETTLDKRETDRLLVFLLRFFGGDHCS